MTEKIFDCLVLGAEPQGLWLLSQLYKRYSSVKAGSHLGWLQMRAETRHISIGEGLAPVFGISPGEVCRFEIISPKECIEWRRKVLVERFPGLSDLPSTLRPSSKQLAAIRYAMRRAPEILQYAGAVWRHFGRTPELSPEMLTWASLMCTDLHWWDPTLELPADVERLGPSDPKVIRILPEPKLGLVRVKVSESRELTTRNLVLAPSVQEALDMDSKTLPYTFGMLRESLSEAVEYHLNIEVTESPRFKVCAPLVTYLDTDEIADLETEMWPLRFGKEHKVQASVRAFRQTSLDALLDQYRQVLQRLCKLIPGFLEHTHAIWPPLQMDSCFTDDNRAFVFDSLQAGATYLHANTTLRTHSDSKHVFWLGTNVNCSLPYPIGPLVAARELVERLVDKRRVKKARQALLHPL